MNKKTLVALQPSFVPWRGYFDLIDKSDKFIFYDHVQYDKNGWRNRNKILINNKASWITMPVVHKNLDKLLKDVEISDLEHSLEKIIKTISQNYTKHPNYNSFFHILENIFKKNPKLLVDLNIDIIISICDYMGIEINQTRSSKLENVKDKNMNLINLCKRYKCNQYLSGNLAKNYINENIFADNGVTVLWHEFEEPRYQHYKINQNIFFEKLSIIDYLFNIKKNYE